MNHPILPVTRSRLADPSRLVSRRQMLHTAACGFGGLALHGIYNGQLQAASGLLAARAPEQAPRAKRVIFLFMSGGPSQLDLFDPKPLIEKSHGQTMDLAVDENQLSVGVEKYLAMGSIAPIRPRGEVGHDDL